MAFNEHTQVKKVNHFLQFFSQSHSKKLKITFVSGTVLLASVYGILVYLGPNVEKVAALMSVIEFLIVAFGFLIYVLSFVGLVYYFTDEAKKDISNRGGLNDSELIIAQMKYAFVFLLMFYLFSCILIVLFGAEGPSGTQNSAGYIAMVGILLSMAIAFTGMTIGYQFHELRDRLNREHQILTSRKNHTLNLILQSRLSEEYQRNLLKMYVHFPDHINVPDPNESLEINYIIKYGYSFLVFDSGSRFYGTEKAQIEKFKSILVKDEHGKFYFDISQKTKSLADSLGAVDYVLNQFEFLAAGIYKDDLYEPLLFECYAGIVKNLWQRTEKYVLHYREENNRPKTWELIEKLANRWTEMGNNYRSI